MENSADLFEEQASRFILTSREIEKPVILSV
jgi:hypothetical protein